ncbi:TRAP transporter large permease [Microvirga sp. VF16]|uniref:TRAP transporter large permease n=1 Tax=Microvirga sp. VF16 TaxID=2807101 RepID=UPI00193CBAB8|nr:TRAP transporter large permease [Microvirga sp. VF16]QRM33997.1 TRAP transporter large permease [Microvirga sp. VF16]
MILTLFIAFVILLLIGVPVAFSTGIAALIVVLLDPALSARLLVTKTFGGMDSFPLMAIPFFILAGEIMAHSGLTQRIVNLAMALVGHIRGGLAHVTVMANALMSGVSGSASADCAATGSILIPSMIKQGYKPAFAALITAFSAMMGPIIPPSIFMIIYGSMAGVSIGKLFIGGVIPGLLIGASLMLLVAILVRRSSFAVPTTTFSFQKIVRTTVSAAWALVMPIVIVGGILGGIMTPTEAGIVAVVYSLFVGFFVYRTLTLRQLRELTMSAALSSANIMMVVGFASVFGTILALGRFETVVMNVLFGITDQPWLLVAILIVALAIIGSLMDEISTAVLFVPTLAKIGVALHYDPVHFGVVMVLAIMLGAVVPPVATLLFIGCTLAKIPLSAIMKLVWVFLIPLLFVNLLIAYVPVLVTFLPSLF